MPSSIKQIKLVVLDVDGVLTDGRITLNSRGQESKSFHARDGLGIRAAIGAGLQVGVLSSRCSTVVNCRMSELGVDLIIQGERNKKLGMTKIIRRAGVNGDQTAFLGDDLLDLPAMQVCGYPMAVADAAEEVKALAEYVTKVPGGYGAVRDAMEHILKSQGLWDQVVSKYKG